MEISTTDVLGYFGPLLLLALSLLFSGSAGSCWSTNWVFFDGVGVNGQGAFGVGLGVFCSFFSCCFCLWDLTSWKSSSAGGSSVKP